MNSLWPFVDAASFQFSLVWAILWALMARTKEPPGMQTEWLETKRVNTQHSVRSVVENKVFRGSSVRYLCSHIWCSKFIQKLASKFNQRIAYHSLEASKQNDPAESRLEVDCFNFLIFWCFLFNGLCCFFSGCIYIYIPVSFCWLSWL